MMRNHRIDERVTDFGRVEAHDLCSFPGVLDDISASGCKVHFPVPLCIDMENEYNLKIKLSGCDSQPLKLICLPRWKKLNESQTEVGFSFLRSPDTNKLESYISKMLNTDEGLESIYSLIINNEPVIIG